MKIRKNEPRKLKDAGKLSAKLAGIFNPP